MEIWYRGRSETERQLESHVPRVVGAAHIFLGPEGTLVPLNRSLQAGSSNALHCMDTFPCSITFLRDPFPPIVAEFCLGSSFLFLVPACHTSSEVQAQC